VCNSCSAAGNDPNLLLFCDGSKNNIPWQRSVKLAGTYPLPWFGISVNSALRALAGLPIGTSPLQYGVFTAGTGFSHPNGIGTFWLAQLVVGVTSVSTAQYGAATYYQPSAILQGRLIRLGVDVKW
jgi:hypothetical protein